MMLCLLRRRNRENKKSLQKMKKNNNNNPNLTVMLALQGASRNIVGFLFHPNTRG